MALISSVKKELRNILHKANETESRLIVLHVGHKDLWSGSKVVDLLNDFKQIISWLIKHSQLKVCVSLIIPGGGQYPRLDSEVMSLNRSLSDFITSLRDDSNYKNRVFTANNNRLREFISKKVGAHGTQLTLSNHGKNILWLKLRDSIKRSLHPLSTNKPSSQERNGVRPTYRRKDTNNPSSRPRNNAQNDAR